ncbi:unnamed protein product [Protopolystoma xenopodis]|uniref:Secreted protein n=1 Tax=Protopolystoma xenopodis TaxID=117903 RepID=A0A448X513_9PLAT|nr:unnamed protein product [Protopolystoma xenopodis]
MARFSSSLSSCYILFLFGSLNVPVRASPSLVKTMRSWDIGKAGLHFCHARSPFSSFCVSHLCLPLPNRFVDSVSVARVKIAYARPSDACLSA